MAERLRWIMSIQLTKCNLKCKYMFKQRLVLSSVPSIMSMFCHLMRHTYPKIMLALWLFHLHRQPTKQKKNFIISLTSANGLLPNSIDLNSFQMDSMRLSMNVKFFNRTNILTSKAFEVTQKYPFRKGIPLSP